LSEEVVLRPTGDADRIELLDALRGLAIFGILPVNLLGFSAPLSIQVDAFAWWTSSADRIALWLIYFLAVGKFYSLFAFLFGVGFGIQLSRAEVSGLDLLPSYLRRLSGLLVLGLLHASLVWWGDVLHIYAVLGLILLVLGGSSIRTLLFVAGIAMALPAALAIFEALSSAMAHGAPALAQTPVDYRAMAADSIAAHRLGGFAVMVHERLRTLEVQESRALLTTVPQALSMLVGGVAAVRGDLFQRPELLRRSLPWMFGLGVICNLIFVLSQGFANPLQPSLLSALGVCCYSVGAPSLCLFYVGSVASLWREPQRRLRWMPILAVGRTALSNYLLQSLAFTSLFALSGAQLYGEIGPALGLLMSLVFFVIQMVLSVLWMKHHEFGPAEFLLRALTYWGRPLRSRRDSQHSDVE
jgi:uncharacterized protein